MYNHIYIYTHTYFISSWFDHWASNAPSALESSSSSEVPKDSHCGGWNAASRWEQCPIWCRFAGDSLWFKYTPLSLSLSRFYIYIHIHIYIYVYIHMYIYTYIYIYTVSDSSLGPDMYVCMSVCLSVCMSVCLYVMRCDVMWCDVMWCNIM